MAKKVMSKSQNVQDYNESHIKVYKGLDAIRKRPSMYMGEMGSPALKSFLKELADNAQDEYYAGRNKVCKVTVIDDNTIIVADESSGIPVGLNKDLGIPTLTALFTHLHAGGKFDNKAFKVSAGCFVGSTVLKLFDGSILTFEQLYDRWQTDCSPISMFAYDADHLSPTKGAITHVQLSKYVSCIARVKLDNDYVIESTVDHPYCVMAEGQLQEVQAQNLKEGMTLVSDSDSDSASGSNQRSVKSVEIQYLVAPVPVYGLTLDPQHVYRIEPGVYVKNTHGVGLKGCTALSETLEVWTYRDAEWYYQKFGKGKIVCELKKAKPNKEVQELLPSSNKKGTIIRLVPDLSIIGRNAKIPFKSVTEYLTNLALLNKGFKVQFKTIIKGKEKVVEFYNKTGPAEYVQHISEELKVSLEGKPLVIENDHFDLALQLSDYDEADGLRSYVTSSLTIDGGKHVEGFWSAFTKAIGESANRNHKFQPRDLKYGLIGYINLRISGPKFSSQTKEKLVGFAVDHEKEGQLITDRQLELDKPEQAIHQFLYPLLINELKKNKGFAKAVLERATQVAKAREQSKELLKAASKLKVKCKHDPLPDVLYTATRAKPEERELFLVEGSSAGGCLCFDTEVLQADGSILTFAEMVEGHAEGVSFNSVSWDTETQTQTVGYFDEPRITKYVTELVEVELSDGTIVKCTPDHPFLLDDGSTYVAAESLVPGQGLQTIDHELIGN